MLCFPTTSSTAGGVPGAVRRWHHPATLRSRVRGARGRGSPTTQPARTWPGTAMNREDRELLAELRQLNSDVVWLGELQ